MLRPVQTNFLLFQQIFFVLVCIHPGTPRVPPQVLASGPKPCGGNNKIYYLCNSCGYVLAGFTSYWLHRTSYWWLNFSIPPLLFSVDLCKEMLSMDTFSHMAIFIWWCHRVCTICASLQKVNRYSGDRRVKANNKCYQTRRERFSKVHISCKLNAASMGRPLLY